MTAPLQVVSAHLRSAAPTMRFVWHGPPGSGFGELSFYLDEDGDWHCDSETLGREFTEQVFSRWLEKVIFDGEPPSEGA